MDVRLDNGTVLELRQIRPQDKGALASALSRLSPASSRARFLSPKSTFTPSELRYLTEIDFCDHYALVAVPHDRPGRIVAVGRWVRDPERPDRAEAAITVADHLQGQGLGRALGFAIADAARERGVRRFTATMLAENVASHRVFDAISERLRVVHDGPNDELVAELAA